MTEQQIIDALIEEEKDELDSAELMELRDACYKGTFVGSVLLLSELDQSSILSPDIKNPNDASGIQDKQSHLMRAMTINVKMH